MIYLGTKWIDCREDGNLLATAGDDKDVKIYDKRLNKIVKKYHNLHSGKYSEMIWTKNNITLIVDAIQTVRWNANGSMLATASRDSSIQLLDLRCLKSLATIPTEGNSNLLNGNKTILIYLISPIILCLFPLNPERRWSIPETNSQQQK